MSLFWYLLLLAAPNIIASPGNSKLEQELRTLYEAPAFGTMHNIMINVFNFLKDSCQNTELCPSDKLSVEAYYKQKCGPECALHKNINFIQQEDGDYDVQTLEDKQPIPYPSDDATILSRFM